MGVAQGVPTNYYYDTSGDFTTWITEVATLTNPDTVYSISYGIDEAFISTSSLQSFETWHCWHDDIGVKRRWRGSLQYCPGHSFKLWLFAFLSSDITICHCCRSNCRAREWHRGDRLYFVNFRAETYYLWRRLLQLLHPSVVSKRISSGVFHLGRWHSPCPTSKPNHGRYLLCLSYWSRHIQSRRSRLSRCQSVRP